MHDNDSDSDTEKSDKKAVLENIAQRIDDAENDKTEISDDEYAALGLESGYDEHYVEYQTPDHQPRAHGHRNTIPIKYTLYHINGKWLAVETHSKLQGEKRVRYYATGVGRMELTAAGLDADVLRERLPEDAVSDKEIEAAVEMYEWAEEETACLLLEEPKGMLMQGHTLYGSVRDSGLLVEDAVSEMNIEDEELAYEARRAVRDARNKSHPSDVQADIVEVQAGVEFDHTHLLD